MTQSIHQVSLNGALLKRGFWLYIWEIAAPSGENLYYVGRTGDSSSANAQSPISRLSQHLGKNTHSNALCQRLSKASVKPESCGDIRMFAYGPIFSEGKNSTQHKQRRDVVAALEKALGDAMREAGYNVINTVHCRKPSDERLFQRVRSAYSVYFSKLRK